ncbi:hypothetical protein [Methanofollis sp. UBA420]|jgi:Kef-type K+ transport system membrane component KefB|uniref:hypothetical protein n=1 Tax=Methanofollis sp. UBA420 TaxID=1915514 RepID=UPI00316ADB1D
MDILLDTLIFILTIYPLLAIVGTIGVGLYVKIHQKRKTGDAFQFATAAFTIFVIAYLSIPLVMKYEIPQYLLNEFTLMSLILALIALTSNNLKELNADQPFISLNSEIKAIQDEITTEGEQNTQKIITQINHLEESQKTLAQQIQSLKDSILASEPSEPHEGDDAAGLSTKKE